MQDTTILYKYTNILGDEEIYKKTCALLFRLIFYISWLVQFSLYFEIMIFFYCIKAQIFYYYLPWIKKDEIKVKWF